MRHPESCTPTRSVRYVTALRNSVAVMTHRCPYPGQCQRHPQLTRKSAHCVLISTLIFWPFYSPDLLSPRLVEYIFFSLLLAYTITQPSVSRSSLALLPRSVTPYHLFCGIVIDGQQCSHLYEVRSDQVRSGQVRLG